MNERTTANRNLKSIAVNIQKETFVRPRYKQSGGNVIDPVFLVWRDRRKLRCHKARAT